MQPRHSGLTCTPVLPSGLYSILSSPEGGKWIPRHSFAAQRRTPVGGPRLDALFFLLYGMTHDESAEILITFPIMKGQDAEPFGG
jgi:hypothetical protein